MVDPPLGGTVSVKGIQLGECEEFYANGYSADRITLVLAGDIPSRKPSVFLKPLTAACRPRVPSYLLSPWGSMVIGQGGEIRLPTVGQRFVMGTRAPEATHPDCSALQVINEVLLEGDSSRLQRQLIAEDEVVAAAYGYLSLLRDCGVYEMGFDLRPGCQADEVIVRVRKTLKTVVEDGLTNDEINRAKARIQTRFYRGLQTNQQRAEALGYWSVVADDPGFLLERAARLDAVDQAAVLSAARRWLDHDRWSLVVAYPQDSEPKP